MIVPHRIAALAASSIAVASLGATARAQDPIVPGPTLAASRLPPALMWRSEAAGAGVTARVLVIGAHPDDEDNALIAWLSLGKHVETAYLSLTRGEHGVNVLGPGRERESLLGMVRTAEILEERKRDGARQYFTRGYDFGQAKNDSALAVAWPHDSLLDDVCAVVRVFRPQVIVALFAGDTTEHDLQHREAGRLAREAFQLANDTTRLPAARTSLIGAWQPTVLYQRVPSEGPGVSRVDVGALDPQRGRTDAELGAELRSFQRTQPPVPAPPVGPTFVFLRRELTTASAESMPDPTISGSLFADDTSWARFDALPLTDSARVDVDSLAAIARVLGSGESLSRDAVVAQLSSMLRLAALVRASLACSSDGLHCTNGLGDLASALATVRERASRALLDASGVVVDATAAREAVAVGDSVPVTITVFNGGVKPVDVTRVFAMAMNGGSFAFEDTTRIAAGAARAWTHEIRMFHVTHPWWLTAGLASGMWLYASPEPPGSRVNHGLIAGEDRMRSSTAEVSLQIAASDVTTTVGPIIARDSTTLRGDDRHPVVGVPRLSILLERGREYAPANVPFERLYRVWVGSAISRADKVQVKLDVPTGLRPDSATRTVALPPFGSRTLFFRVRGTWPAAELPIRATATAGGAEGRAMRTAGRQEFSGASAVNDGLVAFEYPHIPTQRLPVNATDSVLAVSLRLPAGLRVAFVRGARDEQLDGRLAELGVEVYPIDAAAIGATDLSAYSTILIAPHAYAEVEALQADAAAVRQFAEAGGTVLVLFGGPELTIPGVLPYPVSFGATDSARVTVLDPEAPVQIVTPRSPLLTRPNRITSADFIGWRGARAIELPTTADSRYQRILDVHDDAGVAVNTAILVAHVGRGLFIYTGLNLDQQIETAANSGAARLIVNLMAKRATRDQGPGARN